MGVLSPYLFILVAKTCMVVDLVQSIHVFLDQLSAAEKLERQARSLNLRLLARPVIVRIPRLKLVACPCTCNCKANCQLPVQVIPLTPA